MMASVWSALESINSAFAGVLSAKTAPEQRILARRTNQPDLMTTD
jgi:hypothetical protein